MSSKFQSLAKNILSRHILFCLVPLVEVAGVSCNEALPPYEDPTNLFRSKVNMNYWISPTDNSLKIHLTIINNYDETLQGIAILRGKFVMSIAEIPEFSKITAVDSSHMVIARSYNPSTRVLTIDPGDSVRFSFSWDLKTDQGIDIRQGLIYLPDPTCPNRLITYPITAKVNCEVQLFERTGRVVSGVQQYIFRHEREYVPPRGC